MFHKNRRNSGNVSRPKPKGHAPRTIRNSKIHRNSSSLSSLSTPLKHASSLHRQAPQHVCQHSSVHVKSQNISHVLSHTSGRLYTQSRRSIADIHSMDSHLDDISRHPSHIPHRHSNVVVTNNTNNSILLPNARDSPCLSSTKPVRQHQPYHSKSHIPLHGYHLPAVASKRSIPSSVLSLHKQPIPRHPPPNIASARPSSPSVSAQMPLSTASRHTNVVLSSPSFMLSNNLYNHEPTVSSPPMGTPKAFNIPVNQHNVFRSSMPTHLRRPFNFSARVPPEVPVPITVAEQLAHGNKLNVHKLVHLYGHSGTLSYLTVSAISITTVYLLSCYFPSLDPIHLLRWINQLPMNDDFKIFNPVYNYLADRQALRLLVSSYIITRLCEPIKVAFAGALARQVYESKVERDQQRKMVREILDSDQADTPESQAIIRRIYEAMLKPDHTQLDFETNRTIDEIFDIKPIDPYVDRYPFDEVLEQKKLPPPRSELYIGPNATKNQRINFTNLTGLPLGTIAHPDITPEITREHAEKDNKLIKTITTMTHIDGRVTRTVKDFRDLTIHTTELKPADPYTPHKFHRVHEPHPYSLWGVKMAVSKEFYDRRIKIEQLAAEAGIGKKYDKEVDEPSRKQLSPHEKFALNTRIRQEYEDFMAIYNEMEKEEKEERKLDFSKRFTPPTLYGMKHVDPEDIEIDKPFVSKEEQTKLDEEARKTKEEQDKLEEEALRAKEEEEARQIEELLQDDEVYEGLRQFRQQIRGSTRDSDGDKPVDSELETQFFKKIMDNRRIALEQDAKTDSKDPNDPLSPSSSSSTKAGSHDNDVGSDGDGTVDKKTVRDEAELRRLDPRLMVDKDTGEVRYRTHTEHIDDILAKTFGYSPGQTGQIDDKGKSKAQLEIEEKERQKAYQEEVQKMRTFQHQQHVAYKMLEKKVLGNEPMEEEDPDAEAFLDGETKDDDGKARVTADGKKKPDEGKKDGDSSKSSAAKTTVPLEPQIHDPNQLLNVTDDTSTVIPGVRATISSQRSQQTETHDRQRLIEEGHFIEGTRDIPPNPTVMPAKPQIPPYLDPEADDRVLYNIDKMFDFRGIGKEYRGFGVPLKFRQVDPINPDKRVNKHDIRRSIFKGFYVHRDGYTFRKKYQIDLNEYKWKLRKYERDMQNFEEKMREFRKQEEIRAQPDQPVTLDPDIIPQQPPKTRKAHHPFYRFP